jgi:hypothetical protein
MAKKRQPVVVRYTQVLQENGHDPKAPGAQQFAEQFPEGTKERRRINVLNRMCAQKRTRDRFKDKGE